MPGDRHKKPDKGRLFHIRQPYSAAGSSTATAARSSSRFCRCVRFLDGETHTALTVHFQYLHLHHVTDFQEVGHVLHAGIGDLGDDAPDRLYPAGC